MAGGCAGGGGRRRRRVLPLDRDHLHRQVQPGQFWFAFAIAYHNHTGAGLREGAEGKRLTICLES